jgi:S-adenosyl methyltransferase
MTEQLIAPSGSYLVLSDGTNAVNGPAAETAQRGYNLSGAVPYCLRSPGQLASILDGLDLAEPGLASCSRRRPEHGADRSIVSGPTAGTGAEACLASPAESSQRERCPPGPMAQSR